MKKIVCLIGYVFIMAQRTEAVSSPQDDYLHSYVLINEADNLAKKNALREAKVKYELAYQKILKIKKENPEYEPSIINYRLEYVGKKLNKQIQGLNSLQKKKEPTKIVLKADQTSLKLLAVNELNPGDLIISPFSKNEKLLVLKNQKTSENSKTSTASFRTRFLVLDVEDQLKLKTKVQWFIRDSSWESDFKPLLNKTSISQEVKKAAEIWLYNNPEEHDIQNKKNGLFRKLTTIISKIRQYFKKINTINNVNKNKGEEHLLVPLDHGMVISDEILEKVARRSQGDGILDLSENSSSTVELMEATTSDSINSPEEQFQKGDILFYDDVNPENKKKAINWYKKAALQGHQRGINAVGTCYFHGIGVERNREEAVKWFRQSAEQGNALGQFNLGWCYLYGMGVPIDKELAIVWLKKSADQGKETAQQLLDEAKKANN